MEYGKREKNKVFGGYQFNCTWKQILNLRPPHCKEKPVRLRVRVTLTTSIWNNGIHIITRVVNLTQLITACHSTVYFL